MQDLTTNAMLVNLSISNWTARKYDKKVTAKVAEDNHTTMDAGRYNKNLLPADNYHYKQLWKIVGEIRTWHYAQTMPWDDTGWRLLPSANFLSYSEGYKALHDKWQAAKADFLAAYPDMVKAAEQLLNGLFNPLEYPEVKDLDNLFHCHVSYRPIPSCSDFRVQASQLGQTAIDEIKAEMQAAADNQLADAMSDLYSRLHGAVKHMVDRLGTEGAIFRDSLIGNVQELCDLLPRLNITGDSNLNALTLEVESKLACWQPEDLRDDKQLRQKVAGDAQKIIDDMSAFMS